MELGWVAEDSGLRVNLLLVVLVLKLCPGGTFLKRQQSECDGSTISFWPSVCLWLHTELLILSCKFLLLT